MRMDATAQAGATADGAGSLFLPSTERAGAIDRAIRERLSDSLRWAADELGSDGLRGRDLSGWSARPTDFGFYFDLASAVHHGVAEDGRGALAAVERALGQSIDQGIERDGTGAGRDGRGPRLATMRPPYFTAEETECLVRWFDMEPDNAMALLPLDEVELTDASRALTRALDVLRTMAPEFYGEFQAITAEIVFAKPGPEARLSFGGASSFALWGGMALNKEAHPDWWLYLPRIVHEYSHNLLFGIARDEPLVLNRHEERYRSPLRSDPRPVDGIFHAAFVSAREATAMQQILDALGQGDAPGAPGLRAYCRRTRDDSARSFADCRVVLREHAKLSGLGTRILDDTEAWMASAPMQLPAEA
jgi:HEXXH motif-containing protein